MIAVGYGLSSEEYSGPELLRQAQQAEQAGFTVASISDHFHPWTPHQGQSPFVWSVLGAIAATTQLTLATTVTCPILRTHPAVLAQAAATTASLMEGRFIFGVGTGENLNEHILGDKWPEIETRLEMLEEAVALIRELWKGESTSWHGEHYSVENARIYSLPAELPPIYVSAFGEKAMTLASRIGDGYIGTAPDADLVGTYSGRGGKLAYTKVCWGPDEQQARARLHEMWPTSGLTGQLAQEIATPELFAAAAELVTVDQAVGKTPCGPDPQPYVDMVRAYADAGYDTLTISQIGGDVEGFLGFWNAEVAPALQRELQPA